MTSLSLSVHPTFQYHDFGHEFSCEMRIVVNIGPLESASWAHDHVEYALLSLRGTGLEV